MSKPTDGNQRGETGHAEGQHGDKTHQAFLDQVQSGTRDADERDAGPTRSTEGRHRLHEDREQHDEGEKHSEATRKRDEIGKGRLDPDLPGVSDRINGERP